MDYSNWLNTYTITRTTPTNTDGVSQIAPSSSFRQGWKAHDSGHTLNWMIGIQVAALVVLCPEANPEHTEIRLTFRWTMDRDRGKWIGKWPHLYLVMVDERTETSKFDQIYVNLIVKLSRRSLIELLNHCRERVGSILLESSIFCHEMQHWNTKSHRVVNSVGQELLSYCGMMFALLLFCLQ